MPELQPDLILLCATEGEARRLKNALEVEGQESVCGKTTLHGHLLGYPCRLVMTGIGGVNAAHALTVALERRRPALVLQFGIAGAYVPSGVPVGAVACATEEIYGDVGVLAPGGWLPADEIGIPLVPPDLIAPGDPPRFNRFPLDPGLVSRAADACDARSGPFVTVNQCSGVQAVGDEIHRRFGALCESMEGAAAAHVCTLYGVPFLEVRGVSNLVEDRNREAWDIPGAAKAAQDAVMKIIENFAEITGVEMGK